MRVKYLQCMAGEYMVRDVGQEFDVEDAEAGRLIEAGFAEEVKAKKAKAGEVEDKK